MAAMRRRGLRFVGACFGVVVLAGAGAPSEPLGGLPGALADAQAHVAPLAAHAANAPEATLEQPVDDEYDAFAAVTAAEDALGEVERDAPAALPGTTAIALHTAIVSAHTSLRSYTHARMLGDRQAMQQAAADALSSLRRASELASAAQKLRRTR